MTPSSSPTPSPRTLRTGPAGSGKTTEALRRVKEAATAPGRRGRSATRPGDVLLLLPTYAQAMHLARAALARWSARAVLDDPFATFTSAGERYLEGFRVRALPSAGERDLFMVEALRVAAVPPFSPLADRPSFRARLLQLVKETKQSGEEPARARERLETAALALPPGGRERLLGFLRVFEAYDVLLRRARMEDHEDTLRRLARELATSPPARLPRLLVVDGFDDFTPIEMAILDRLGDGIVRRGGEILVTLPYDPRRPALFAASHEGRAHLLRRGFRETRSATFRRVPGGALALLGERLFLEGTVRPESVSPGGEVEIVVAGDPEDEAEAVARRARRLREEPGGLPGGWRDLGVVVRRLDEAGGRLLAAFDRLGVPARLVGAGTPLASEAWVRALVGPLRLLAVALDGSLFEASRLMPWLRWQAVVTGGGEATAAVDRLEMRFRREGWPRDLAAFLEASAPTLGDLLSPLDALPGLSRLRGWSRIEAALRAAFPRWVGLPPAGGLDASGRPRDAAADERRARAAGARDALLRLLAELAGAARRTGLDEDVDAAHAVSLLLDAVERARFALPDRRLDVVNILDFEEARSWELPVVFVAGLARGEVPLHAREDLFLSDEDRETLRDARADVSLPLARDLEVREKRLFYGALTRATRRLVLFRSATTPDGGPRSPTLYLREVERVLDLASVTTTRPAGRAAPREDECFTPLDWRLFAARALNASDAAPRERALARALLADDHDDLLRRGARWKLEGADAVSLDLHGARFERATAVVSTGAIGTALACRHRFFLKRVVGVPEDDAPFAGPGFRARARGTLVHEALHRALAEPGRSAAEVAEDVLRWAAGRSATEVGLLEEVDRALLFRELDRIVRLLRHREAGAASALSVWPDGLELDFGGDDGLELAAGLRLRGRIDRVDRGDGCAAVFDYKLSSGGVESSWKAFKDGLDVQLPLYALSVERLLGVGVVGFTWLAATTPVRYGCWDAEAAPLAGRVGESGTFKAEAAFAAVKRGALQRASDVVAALRAGENDRQVEDPQRCGTCAWRTVCRPSHGGSGDDEAAFDAEDGGVS